MGLLGWILYGVLGIVIFLVLGLIDSKYSVSRVEKLVLSIIFMCFISGICFRFAIPVTENIFLIFLFEMIVELIYDSYFTTLDFFDKEVGNVWYYTALIIISFVINQEFINKVSDVFLTGEDLRIILWFLAFLFLYNFFDKKKIFDGKTNSKNKFISQESVVVSYAKLKNKYYNVVKYSKKNRDIINILYAIMIYQNNRRSKILRNFDYFMFRFNGKSQKLGIMQIESSDFISDVQSIEIVYKKLCSLYYKDGRIDNNLSTCYKVIEEYGLDYEYIKYLFDIIRKF